MYVYTFIAEHDYGSGLSYRLQLVTANPNPKALKHKSISRKLTPEPSTLNPHLWSLLPSAPPQLNPSTVGAFMTHPRIGTQTSFERSPKTRLDVVNNIWVLVKTCQFKLP